MNFMLRYESTMLNQTLSIQVSWSNGDSIIQIDYGLVCGQATLFFLCCPTGHDADFTQNDFHAFLLHHSK